jgi:hypothetical protein
MRNRTNGAPNALLCATTCLMLATLACEEKAETREPSAAQPAETQAAPPPPPEPTPEPPSAPAKTERPKDIDPKLTGERRAAIESKYPDAKGFVVAKELEEKLKANKSIKEKEAAVSAFDRMAKAKWVLFTGPMVNLTDKGFDVAVVYTPQLPNDPMGMSRQFFEVTLEDVAGYDQAKFEAGNMVIVLAKYTGGGKASPAYELVDSKDWN